MYTRTTSVGPLLSERLRLTVFDGIGDNCDVISGSLEGEFGSPPGVDGERAVPATSIMLPRLSRSRAVDLIPDREEERLIH